MRELQVSLLCASQSGLIMRTLGHIRDLSVTLTTADSESGPEDLALAPKQVALSFGKHVLSTRV